MFSLIFLLAFPFLLWKAWQNHLAAKASTAWPTTPGTITKVERYKRFFRSLPRIGFSYSVDGKEYVSERISFAAGYRAKEVDAVLDRYSVGQTVPVHYPPAKPTDAVLETGSGPQVIAPIRMLIICFVLLVILNIARFYLPNSDDQRTPRRTYGNESRP